jgi:chemotaxis protein MotB
MIKRRHEEHENHERWLVSYADFITLLFAFFVVMYATSNSDLEKQKQFEDSVKSELKLTVVNIGSGARGGQGHADAAALDQVLNELVNPVDNFPRRGSPAEVQDFVERQLKRQMSQEEMDQAGIQVRRDALGARVTLNAASFFPSGDARLKKSSLTALSKVANVLATTERRIIIEGHTDDRPIEDGTFPSNWELASLRATSVVRYLAKYHNIKESRLAAMSYADQRPLVANNNEENRARNRRVEILITSQMADPD